MAVIVTDLYQDKLPLWDLTNTQSDRDTGPVSIRSRFVTSAVSSWNATAAYFRRGSEARSVEWDLSALIVELHDYKKLTQKADAHRAAGTRLSDGMLENELAGLSARLEMIDMDRVQRVVDLHRSEKHISPEVGRKVDEILDIMSDLRGGQEAAEVHHGVNHDTVLRTERLMNLPGMSAIRIALMPAALRQRELATALETVGRDMAGVSPDAVLADYMSLQVADVGFAFPGMPLGAGERTDVDTLARVAVADMSALAAQAAWGLTGDPATDSMLLAEAALMVSGRGSGDVAWNGPLIDQIGLYAGSIATSQSNGDLAFLDQAAEIRTVMLTALDAGLSGNAGRAARSVAAALEPAGTLSFAGAVNRLGARITALDSHSLGAAVKSDSLFSFRLPSTTYGTGRHRASKTSWFTNPSRRHEENVAERQRLKDSRAERAAVTAECDAMIDDAILRFRGRIHGELGACFSRIKGEGDRVDKAIDEAAVDAVLALNDTGYSVRRRNDILSKKFELSTSQSRAYTDAHFDAFHTSAQVAYDGIVSSVNRALRARGDVGMYAISSTETQGRPFDADGFRRVVYRVIGDLNADGDKLIERVRADTDRILDRLRPDSERALDAAARLGSGIAVDPSARIGSVVSHGDGVQPPSAGVSKVRSPGGGGIYRGGF